MTSLKPYMIRSVYEWIVDNQLTPYLLVDAVNFDTVVPTNYIEEGKIILNVRPAAIDGLVLGNDEIQFSAIFSGQPMQIIVPTEAVLAVYAKENGKGMVFDPEDPNNTPESPKEEPPKKSHLRVIK